MTANSEEGHTGCQEVRGVERPEDRKSVDQDKQRCPENSPVGQVRLEIAVVNQLFAVKALSLHPAVLIVHVSDTRSLSESQTHRRRYM